jgi:Fe-S cluster assembly ATP-binding protein
LHVILGQNGAGKSTWGRVLLGEKKYEVTDGEIKFRGKNFLKMPTHERAQAGFFLSFQAPPELDGVSAREMLFAAKKTIDPDLISSFRFKKSFLKNLAEVHLDKEFADRDMNKGSSGGERKKMELATLLTLDPQLIFLDEIDSGIDVDAMNVLIETVNKFMENPAKNSNNSPLTRGDEGGLMKKSAIIVSHTDKFLNKLNPTHVHILINGEIILSGDAKLIDEVHKCGFCPYMKNCENK